MNKQREALKIALKVLNTRQDFNYPEFHALQYQAFNMVYEALAEPEIVLDNWTCEKLRSIAWKQCVTTIDKRDGDPELAFSMGFYAGTSASVNAKHPLPRPVAYLDLSNDISYSMRELSYEDAYHDTDTMVPLYTTPPARTPLTDEEIDNLELPPNGCTMRELVRAIERAHGIGEE